MVLPGLPGSRYVLDFDTEECVRHEVDVLVVGSGIAGLTAALHCAQTSRVALVTKGTLTETNTWYAQGGIAGAVGEADSIELHLADTLVVGQGLCDEAAVHAVVAEAGAALRELSDLGVAFDRTEDGRVALAREGGHSLPRVLHSGDATGAEVQGTLTETLHGHPDIEVHEQRFLLDVLTDAGRCIGALVRDMTTGGLEVYYADAVILATGGAGQVYRVTTNPLLATGDGVAAAFRAGAVIQDIEFVQFHPTALDHDAAPRFLISEAVRGEGAFLLDCDHKRFMVGVHPLAELAPRDVVSREIESVMQRCGIENAWLDARHLGREFLEHRFPHIWKTCLEAGYDLSRDLLPVVPAAHYLVGGVLIDLDGRTTVPGLYASGEVSSSGLHGANRMASNSLLEGLVFSRRIARVLAEQPRTGDRRTPRIVGRATAVPGEPAEARALVERLHDVSGRLLGMRRSEEGLAEAIELLDELCAVAGGERSTADLEAVNLLTVASLVARAAKIRDESRGSHARVDYPMRDDAEWLGHIAMQSGQPPTFHRIARPAAECDPFPVSADDVLEKG